MSHRALSPQQFFHGSTAELQPGDVIKPASEVGRKNYPHMASWRRKSTWVTDSELSSWHWGMMGAPHNEDDHVKSYEVEPSETPVKRRHQGGGEADRTGNEYTTPYATVKRRIDIRHPDVPDPSDSINGRGHVGDPVQGRIPGKNWGETQRPYGERAQRFWSGEDGQMAAEDEKNKPPEKKPYEHPGQGKLF